MRRLSATLTVSVAALLAITLTVPAVVAQDADPAAGHPIVGTWFLQSEGATGPPNLATFGCDGTFVGVDPGGGVGLGSWVATGERTLEVTFHFPMQTPEGMPMGHGTVFFSGEVSEDGQTLTGASTVDLATPGGGMTGPRGPVPTTGTRVVVEPMDVPAQE